VTKIRRFTNVPEKNVDRLVEDLRSEVGPEPGIRVCRQPNGLFQVEVVSEDDSKIQSQQVNPPNPAF
jgi:hypothetical protein